MWRSKCTLCGFVRSPNDENQHGLVTGALIADKHGCRRDMKIIRIVTLLCLALVVASTTSATDTIRLTSGDWPPGMSKDGPHHGFTLHIVTETFALVGVEVEYGFFPWVRSLKLAREGKWDGSAVWWDREQRYQYFFYTDPVVPTTMVFFHLKSMEFDWNTYEDLEKLKVGGSMGYDYGKEFNEAEAAGIIQPDRGSTDQNGLQKLLKGRIDVFPGDLVVTYAQIRETFSPEKAALFTHHPKPIFEEPLYLLLSRKVSENEHMRDRFNEGLRMLKESGRYDQIITDGLAGKYDASGE